MLYFTIVFNRESLQRFDKIIAGYWADITEGSYYAPYSHFNLDSFFKRYISADVLKQYIAREQLPAIAPAMLSKQDWTPDTERYCQCCGNEKKTPVGFLTRHHCRQCGQIVCQRCSGYRAWLQTEDSVQVPIEQRVRICYGCYRKNYDYNNRLGVLLRCRNIIFYYVLKLIYSHVLESNIYQAHQQTLLTALYMFQTSDFPDAYQTLWGNIIESIDVSQFQKDAKEKNEKVNYAEPYQWLLLMPDTLNENFMTDHQDKLASIIKLTDSVLLSNIKVVRLKTDDNTIWGRVFNAAAGEPIDRF